MRDNAFANLVLQEDDVINVMKTFGISGHKDAKHVNASQKVVLITHLPAIPILAAVIANKMLKVMSSR